MAVKHLPFVRITPGFPDMHVRAIRVTERNHVNVANWCDGLAIKRVDKNGEESNQRVRVKKLIAQVGDYVVRETVGLDENNKPVYKFYRVKAADFVDNYSSAKKK